MDDLPHTFNVIIPVALLAALLLAAAWWDVRSHRIPNVLVLGGMLAGVAFNAIFPSGLGFLSSLHAGGVGPVLALAGVLTGLAVFLPLYIAGGMGAGDVKLMAMVGAFLGPLATLDAALMVLVVGGAFAVVVVLKNGTVGRVASNLRFMITGVVVNALNGTEARVPVVVESAGKLPYAIAIAGGTIAYGFLSRAGRTFFA